LEEPAQVRRVVAGAVVVQADRGVPAPAGERVRVGDRGVGVRCPGSGSASRHPAHRRSEFRRWAAYNQMPSSLQGVVVLINAATATGRSRTP